MLKELDVTVVPEMMSPKRATSQYSEVDIWISLNKIKDGRVVFHPTLNQYLAVKTKSVIPRRLVNELLDYDFLEHVTGPAAVFEMTELGRERWAVVPAGMKMQGKCDYCGRVQALRPVTSHAKDPYLFLCGVCAE